jgi:hypothetical protein
MPLSIFSDKSRFMSSVLQSSLEAGGLYRVENCLSCDEGEVQVILPPASESPFVKISRYWHWSCRANTAPAPANPSRPNLNLMGTEKISQAHGTRLAF